MNARAVRSARLSPPGNWKRPTSATHASNAPASSARICSAVRPSHSPIANSRSAGSRTGASRWGAARISALCRVRVRSLQ